MHGRAAAVAARLGMTRWMGEGKGEKENEPALELVDLPDRSRDDDDDMADPQCDLGVSSERGLCISAGMLGASIRSWVDGTARRHARNVSIAVLVSLVMMAAALGLAYYVFGHRYSVQLDRMEPIRCNVTSHEVLMWYTVGDGSPPCFMPGLGVRFFQKVPDDGRVVLREASARPAVIDEDAWTDAAGMETLYACNPVGASMTCYYSRDDWRFVSVSKDTQQVRAMLETMGLYALVSMPVVAAIAHGALRRKRG